MGTNLVVNVLVPEFPKKTQIIRVPVSNRMLLRVFLEKTLFYSKIATAEALQS